MFEHKTSEILDELVEPEPESHMSSSDGTVEEPSVPFSVEVALVKSNKTLGRNQAKITKEEADQFSSNLSGKNMSSRDTSYMHLSKEEKDTASLPKADAVSTYKEHNEWKYEDYRAFPLGKEQHTAPGEEGRQMEHNCEPQQYLIIKTPVVIIDVTMKKKNKAKLVIYEEVEAHTGKMVVNPKIDLHLYRAVEQFCRGYCKQLHFQSISQHLFSAIQINYLK